MIEGLTEIVNYPILLSPLTSLHVHRVFAIGKAKAGGSLVARGGAEAERTIWTARVLSHAVSILVVVGEVLINDVVSLHINLFVCIALAVVDGLHAATLLDEEGVAVDSIATIACSLLVELSNLENVFKAIKSYLNDFVIRARQEVAKRIDATLGNKVSDLFRLLQTAAGSVANCPTGLFPCLEVAIREEMDQWRNDVGVNDSLNLGRVAGSDVGDSPARFLSNPVLVRA